jgi:hypothetical protein
MWCRSEKSLLKIGLEPHIPAHRLNRKMYKNKIMEQIHVFLPYSFVLYKIIPNFTGTNLVNITNNNIITYDLGKQFVLWCGQSFT